MPLEAVSLADLLADARVFRIKDASASQPLSSSRPAGPTVRPALAALLPGGGWPTASLVEVLIDASGLGEIQLFLPALAQSQRKRDGDTPWIVWIAPPHEPFAPALAQQGIELSRFIIVRPPGAMEALCAAEQALSSGVCAAVFLWLKGTDDRWLRRLKLAAEEGGALGVVSRPERHRFESSPVVWSLLLFHWWRVPPLSLRKVQGGRQGPIEPEPSPLDLSLFQPSVFEQGS